MISSLAPLQRISRTRAKRILSADNLSAGSTTLRPAEMAATVRPRWMLLTVAVCFVALLPRGAHAAGSGYTCATPTILLAPNSPIEDYYAARNCTTLGTLVIDCGFGVFQYALGFPKLQTVEHVQVKVWPATDLQGLFPVLRDARELYVADSASLRTLQGLQSLRTVGDFAIQNNPALFDLRALSSLQRINGSLLLFAVRFARTLCSLLLCCACG